MKKVAVIAIGGNSLIKAGERGTIEEQFSAVQDTVENIYEIIKLGYNVVITHGNGPQVGNILIQSEAGKHQVPTLPLYYCGAFSQGGMGFMIQQVASNVFAREGLQKDVAAIVTQVLVDADDPAFSAPSKPIGPFYKTLDELQHRIEHHGWQVVEDAGRGYRRVVASPRPIDIIEKKIIKTLIDAGNLVIAVGGGGIPVIRRDNELQGISAVIDKDFASSLLATEINANVFIISTGIEKVALNFKTANPLWLDHITADDCQKYITAGEFAKGSMLPKIEASLKFLQNGGEKVIITSPSKLSAALQNQTGTHITLS
ncbi:MAG: carbamate kinase [Candidatus Cloacimonetes bacterium]|nr:carbamate kinase [Candidatus Cloacimonadota bacterium]